MLQILKHGGFITHTFTLWVHIDVDSNIQLFRPFGHPISFIIIIIAINIIIVAIVILRIIIITRKPSGQVDVKPSLN